MHRKAILLLTLLNSVIVSAQTTLNWRDPDATSGNWSGSNNWWNGASAQAPAGSEILRFGNNHQLTMTNDLSGAPADRYRIYFDAGATSSRTIGGSTLNTFYDFGTVRPLIQNDSTALHTLNFPMAVGPSYDMEINPVQGNLTIGGTISVPTGRNIQVWGNNAKTLTLGGVVSGAGGIRVEENSTVLLTQNNTYSGGTVLNAGSATGSAGVAFNGTQGGSFGTGSITVNTGASLASSAAFVIGGGQNTTRTVNIVGGTMNLQAAGAGGEYFRTLNMTGGTVNFTSGNVYFRAPNGGIDLTTSASASTANITTGIDMTLGSLNLNVADGAAASDLTISGVISQNTGAGSGAKNITLAGGGTVTLSNANTYTGATTINAGKITMGNNTALGTSAVTLNGGTLERDAAGVTVANSIAVSAGGGTILGRQTVDDYTTFSGQLTGSGALTVRGLVTLSNTGNTYSGAITISNASTSYLRLSASEVLGNTATVNLAGSSSYFRLDGGVTETIGGLSGSGSIFVGSAGTGTLKFGGNDGSTSYSGELNNSGGQLFLVKQGTGTFTLAPSTTTYQGLTISKGTVLATNANGGAGPTVTLGDTDTGSNAVAFLTTNNGASRNITVSANGTGTATIGSTTGAGSGNVVFSGLTTLNRATTLTGASTDRTTWTGQITGNVGTLTIAGGNRIVFVGTSNNFSGNIVVSGTGTILQTGVGGGSEHIPDGSSVDVASGAFLKLAGAAGATETINALTGSGTVRRHEAVSGLVTLIIGSANGGGTFSGPLENGAGSLALVKNGSGTQILSGANTYSGGTTINAGTLQIGSGSGTSGVLPGNASIGASGTLKFNYGGSGVVYGGQLSGSGALVITGANNDVQLSGNNSGFTGPVTVDGSSAHLRMRNDNALSGSNAITLVNGGSLSVFSYASSHTILAGSLASSDPATYVRLGAGTNSGLVVGGNNTSTTFAGQIRNDAGGTGFVTKNGSGTLTLTGSNSYGGVTTVNQGTIKLGNMNALGAFQGGRPVTQVVVNSGGAIDLNGTGDATYGYTIAGTGVGGTGALLNTGSGIGNNLAQTSNIKLSANATIGGTGNWSLLTNGYGATTLDLNGQTLTKTGSNQVYLVNSTVTAGTVSISGGNFTFGISESGAGVNASAASFVANTGGTFRVYRSSTVGAITLNGGTLNTAVNLTTNITLNNAANTIAPDGNYRLLSGQLTGAGGFTVASGGGTPGLELNNPANNFAGNVTLNNGTFLRLTAAEVLPNTATLTINTGGNLRMDVTGGGTETVAGLSGGGEIWVPIGNNAMHTLTVGAGNTTSSFSGAVGQSGQNNAYLSLVKTGSGTLTLNGNNQYLGGTTVNGGTLQLNAGAWSVGIIRGTATVNNGATLELGAGGSTVNPMTWTDTVNINGGGTLTVSTGGAPAYDVAQYFGTLNLDSSNGNAALITSGANTGLRFRAQAGSVINSSGPVANTISSNLWLVNTGSPSSSTVNVGAGNLLQVSGNITDYPTLGNTTFIKSGAGSMTLSGNNTYTGTTQISNGLVTAQGGAAIGDLSTVDIANLATAQLQITASEQVGALNGGGGAGGNISLAAGSQLVIGNNNQSTSYAGILSGAGASLYKVGAGNQTLTGNNTFSGGLTIANGTITVPFVAATGTPQPLGTAGSAVNFLGAGSLVVTGSGTLDRGLVLANAANGVEVGGTVTQTGPITGGGSSATFTKSGAGTFNQSGAGSWNSNVNVTAGTYNVNSTGSISGVGVVTLSGGSTMNIDTATQVRASSFNVSSGTLNLNAGTLRTNGITVAGGSAFTWGAATLTMQNGGSGSSGATDRSGDNGTGGAASGPTIYEGTVVTIDNGIGNTVATSNGSVLDLGGLYGGTLLRYDQLRVTGTLNLSANDTLVVNINPYLLRPSSPNDVGTGDWGTLVLVYADTLTGQFDTVTGITSDAIGWTQVGTEINSGRLPSTLGLNEWMLEYRTGYGPLSGGDALLLHYRVAGSVPEPASAGLLVAGALLLRALGRRKA